MRLLLISACAAGLTACASVDATPSATLRDGGLTESKGLRARAAFRVDAPAVRAARTVRLEPARLAGGADDAINPRQREVLLTGLNQALCKRLSRSFQMVGEGRPADLTVRAEITRLGVTNSGSAAVSRVAGFVSPIPFTPRLPVGMGSLVVEGAAANPAGEAKAAMVWARGADMFTTNARASSIGDAFSLAQAFGGDFAKMLARAGDPFKAAQGPKRPRRKPARAECEAWGKGQGAAGFIGARIGLPPEMTAQKPKP